MTLTEFTSPIGTIRIGIHEGRLCALEFTDRWARVRPSVERRFGQANGQTGEDTAPIVRRLSAYFAGDLAALADIEVETGGTPFQRRVWAALRRIPAGRTASYRELARTIGAPAAMRAVGAANGANPVGIVVPCHRVIAADGTLGGYGGGLERKHWLLRHEGAIA